ncbi:MAG TPA: DUF2600 family protein [Candidatus Dormibacteraeota bacterium]|nr:DUF2600 family protein [Candidatus Dormibacteraeota bacterium]
MIDDIRWAVRHVLSSPDRLRYLLATGIEAPFYLARFLRVIVPQARERLAALRTLAEAMPDDRLRAQALASIEGKSYHVAGACILATFLPPDAAREYIAVVAPLETIYDYLDNLCDRHPDVDPAAYPVLHQAIADALDPNAAPRDYYANGPSGDDGGYLRALVEQTQRGLAKLPHYEDLLPYFRESALLYSQMQTFSHYTSPERELACVSWYEEHRERFKALDWHEFACAAGSQFQVYAPLFVAFEGRPDLAGLAYDAYFPYVSSLHVMLDSFIDQSEDAAHGELSFAAVYDGPRRLRERVAFLAAAGRRGFAALPRPECHRFVLRIMTLFYLTHPKVFTQGLDRQARSLLRATE